MAGNSSHWHTTDDELKYIRLHIGRASGLLGNVFTRAQLLEGYIHGSRNRDWGKLDGEVIMREAEYELWKERDREHAPVAS